MTNCFVHFYHDIVASINQDESRNMKDRDKSDCLHSDLGIFRNVDNFLSLFQRKHLTLNL